MILLTQEERLENNKIQVSIEYRLDKNLIRLTVIKFKNKLY